MGAPTLQSPYSEELVLKNIRFRAYDLGNYDTARRRWKDYFAGVNAIFFIVDAADRTRFEEAREELTVLLEDRLLSTVPIVVLGNKVDIPIAASEDELRARLGLYRHITYGREGEQESSGVRPVELFMSSSLKRMGYADAFQWL